MDFPAEGDAGGADYFPVASIRLFVAHVNFVLLAGGSDYRVPVPVPVVFFRRARMFLTRVGLQSDFPYCSLQPAVQ